MDVLLIKGGVVENVICAESVAYAQQFYPDHTCIERAGDLTQFGPGDLYDGVTFTRFVPPPAPPEPITRLDFLRRFTAAQRIAIRSANDPIIADALQMLDLASDVSLDDPDLLMFVGYLEQQGFTGPADTARILGVSA